MADHRTTKGVQRGEQGRGPGACSRGSSSPPGDAEKYGYLERNLPYLTTILAISGSCLIVSQLRFELQEPALFWLGSYFDDATKGAVAMVKHSNAAVPSLLSCSSTPCEVLLAVLP